jgi:predicted ferric reductase
VTVIKKYFVKVEDIKNPVKNIYTVTFSSEVRFKYSPGQFLHLALDEYDGIGQWPESRCFSMQSNPGEEILKITFSIKGNFTKRMANVLVKGKYIWLKLPYGDNYYQNHLKDNCVFIAGGTGITPYISLFTDKSFFQYKNPKLYFGLKSEKYNIYKNELDFANSINSSFKISTIYEDKYGLLNIEQIYNSNHNSVYFISGPPDMIISFRSYLKSNGIEITNIRTDEWQ